VKVIYVAGPYRADTSIEVTRNVHRAAAEAAELLYAHGLAVICPHSMSHGWEGHSDYTPERTLLGCFELVRRCDALLLMRGWQRSEGSVAERDVALEAGIPVFVSRKKLLEWAEA